MHLLTQYSQISTLQSPFQILYVKALIDNLESLYLIKKTISKHLRLKIKFKLKDKEKKTSHPRQLNVDVACTQTRPQVNPFLCYENITIFVCFDKLQLFCIRFFN